MHLVAYRNHRQNLGATAHNYHDGRRTSLEMVYGKVFVAGGAKGVGRAVIDKLVTQGSSVVALVRREDAKAELEAIEGDSMSQMRLSC